MTTTNHDILTDSEKQAIRDRNTTSDGRLLAYAAAVETVNARREKAARLARGAREATEEHKEALAWVGLEAWPVTKEEHEGAIDATEEALDGLGDLEPNETTEEQEEALGALLDALHQDYRQRGYDPDLGDHQD